MKTTIALFSLLFLIAFKSTAQDVAPTQLITNVLTERLEARLLCMRIVIDYGKIQSAQLHAVRYMKFLEKIDTTGCPQDFRMAWLAYVQTWERKYDAHRAQENLLDTIPLLTGNTRGLTDIAKRMESSDTDEAWRGCETAAMESGIDSSKVTLK